MSQKLRPKHWALLVSAVGMILILLQPNPEETLFMPVFLAGGILQTYQSDWECHQNRFCSLLFSDNPEAAENWVRDNQKKPPRQLYIDLQVMGATCNIEGKIATCQAQKFSFPCQLKKEMAFELTDKIPSKVAISNRNFCL